MKSFFPYDLKEGWPYINNEQQENNNKGNQDSQPHIEDIQERGEESSQSEGSTVTHKYFGGIDIEEHERDQDRNQYRYHRSGDIRLIPEGHYSQYK